MLLSLVRRLGAWHDRRADRLSAAYVAFANMDDFRKYLHIQPPNMVTLDGHYVAANFTGK